VRPNSASVVISNNRLVRFGRGGPYYLPMSDGARKGAKDRVELVTTVRENAADVALSFGRQPTPDEIAKHWESHETASCTRVKAMRR
jgi:hypothetical protein